MSKSKDLPSIVVATGGYRDYIVVGYAERIGDMWVIPAPNAVVRRYRQRGIPGAAADPDLTVLDRGETTVRVPVDAVVQIWQCGPKWEEEL